MTVNTQFMRLIAEQRLYIFAFLPEKKKVKYTCFFNGFYGGHVEQLTDICKQLKLGGGERIV